MYFLQIKPNNNQMMYNLKSFYFVQNTFYKIV